MVLSEEKIKSTLGDGIGALTDAYLKSYLSAHDTLSDLKDLHAHVIQEVERPLMVHVLTRVNGNQTKAAEILGLNRNTLRKKMQTLQIVLPE